MKKCESNGSHEVLNSNATIVAVCIDVQSTETLVGSFCEWVSDQTITGLEANLRLEGVLTNGTDHLERNVWAIEQTCVIRGSTLVTNNVVLVTRCSVSGGQVCRIRIDVDTILTLENTSEGVTGVINVQVSVECRGVVENTSHGQCRRNVSRAHDDVALSATSSLCDCVSITLDLEQETLELLNGPTTIGVNVEVESTSGSNVLNSTLLSNLVDSSDNFAVDLSKNLCGENVCEFRFSVQTVDCLEVLCQF